MSTSSAPETHEFKAEVNEILSIVVNSLYSHKEVFLRELISNASDALDHLSFRALTDHTLLGEERELRIELIPDQAARTLTIRDDGVGMTHDELIANLGTIARSGSKRLMQSLSGDARKDVSLIGQFGVGFYSAYLVADRVTVTSRAAGETAAWTWESDAKGAFSVRPAERAERGTDVVLHLKPEEDEFLQEWTLRSLVRKYSDFVRYPIRLRVERQRPKGDGGEAASGTSKETETVLEWETVNTASALWARPRAEITEEQYREFYKHLSHDWSEPLAWTHFRVEGTQELTGLLFVPKEPPLDLMDRRSRGLRLFVKRVFIMEDAEELLPEWLRFVRGVVDSEDLPLNVSRELLQEDRTTRVIRKQVVKHVLTLLEDLAREEAEVPAGTPGDTRRYTTFWNAFGRILKEGVHGDPEYRDRLSRLLRYPSSHGEDLTSLADYVQRMPSEQPAIYWIAAESLTAARQSPQLEALRKKGWEVLYMVDSIDEWVVAALREFEGEKLVSVAHGDLQLPDESKPEDAEKTGELAPLLDKLQAALGDEVQAVRVSRRLADSPACLVSDEHAPSPHLERLLRAHGQTVPQFKRTLELNPDHPVVRRLHEMAGDPARQDEVNEWAQLLHDQALIAEGTMPSDPARLARAISKLMSR